MVAHIPGKKWEDKPEITEEERKFSCKLRPINKPNQNMLPEFSRKRQQQLYLCHRDIYF
jgi:hypothetical protein